MIPRSQSLFLALGLSLGGLTVATPVLAVSQIETATNARTATTVEPELLSSDRLDFAAADRLYARAVLADDLAAVQARLAALSASPDTTTACRAAVLMAVLQWRDGQAETASDTVSAALTRCETTDALLLRARLLDIQGQAGAATAFYERARARSDQATERAMIDRRIAIIGVTGRHPDALAVWARQSGEADHAAAVLGLLGRTADALALYRPTPQGAGRYGAAVRRADWAITAGDNRAAADAAWRAVEAGATSEDRLYALALLVESYRAHDDLIGAEVDLAAHLRSPEIDQTRLDVLLELGRYDEAVAFARTSGDPSLRERLLGVLRAAGRTQEVETEYARLIRTQPAEPRWTNDLAAFHLQSGNVDQATEVYRAFFAANRDRPEAQIEAARRMIAMGMGEQARALLGDTAARPELAAAVRRFEVETAIDQGREAEAGAGLQALRAMRPINSAVLLGVAEDYERLGRQDLALDTLLSIERSGATLDDDQQAHIAELAYAAGRPEEALERWRTLWARTQLPARKTYLQRLIIRAAQRLDRLEAIGNELEQRIAAGTAGQGEVNLLVEIRIAQEDGPAAERAVRTYAERSGTGEVRTLEQLASVQARLRDYSALNRTLRRLADVDPANADAYLRRQIVNILRFPDPTESEAERNARVDAALARIQSAGRLDQAEAARFAASIYTSGYRLDEALVQHRRALALAPADVDALLEFTVAQKGRGDVAQAATLLQYKAETATTEAGFVAAVNGLLDILASSGEEAEPIAPELVQARLSWARRATFERILTYGDDVRLSSLVGDIGQDRDDPDQQLRALQSSLAVAGDQKPAVLRQLIALTSPGETGAGDSGRKVIYGRRLVAMRKPYPPEVYADLARAFLEQDDVAGAERAFALMGDMGGLVNVEALRGDAYAGVGRTRDALGSYRLALLQDQDNLDLLARTAVLMEASGDREAASALYWKAVNLLVQRQPSRLVGDAPPNLDAAQYGPTLIEGLLLTWPKTQSASRLAAWRASFETVLAEATTDGAPQRLSDAPRLALATTINHRLAAALGEPSLFQAEAALVERYGADADYRGALAAYRSDPQTQEARDWPLNDLRRQADQTGESELDMILAFEAGDHARIRSMMARAIALDAPWRAARQRGDEGRQPELLTTLLLKAAELGSDTMLREDVLAPLEATDFSDAALFDIYRIDPSSLARLEAAAGRRLLDDDAMITLLVTRSGDPLPVAGAASRRRSGPRPSQPMAERFDEDRLIGLYEAMVVRMEQTGEVSGLQETIAGSLLERSLTPARQARFQTILIRDIRGERSNLPNSVINFTGLLLRLDAPAANRPVLLEAARAAAVRYPDGSHLPEVLSAWFAGDRVSAFEAAMGLIEDVKAPAGSPLQVLVRTQFATERQAAFDAFLARSTATREEAAQFQRRFLAGGLQQTSADPQLMLAYAKLVALEPGNAGYVAALMALQARAGSFDALIATAAPYVQSHVEDQEATTVLGLAYRMVGSPDEAARVAQASSVDLDDADWIGQLAIRAARPRSGEADMLTGFAPTWSAYQSRFPEAPAVRALAEPEQEWRPVESTGGRPLDRLTTAVAAANASPNAAGDALRGLWRATVPRGREDGDTSERQALIDSLADPLRAGYSAQVADLLIQRSDITAELSAELGAVSPQAQGRQMRLYRLVARGLSQQGTAEVRRGELALRAAGEPMGLGDLALYLALLDESGGVLDASDLVGLERQLQAALALTPGLRLAAARVIARSGMRETVEGLVQAALLQTLYPSPSSYTEPGDPSATSAAFVEAIAALPDAADRRRAYDSLRAVFERQAVAIERGRFDPLPSLPEEPMR